MNWIAIIIAIIVNSVLGSLWFSPMLFAKKWQEWEGHKEGMGMGGGSSVGPFIEHGLDEDPRRSPVDAFELGQRAFRAPAPGGVVA